GRDLVRLAPGQHLCQRALARAIGAHDGVDLAGVDSQVDAFEDFVSTDSYVQILDFQQTHSWFLFIFFTFCGVSRRCLPGLRSATFAPLLRTPSAARETPACRSHSRSWRLRLPSSIRAVAGRRADPHRSLMSKLHAPCVRWSS